MYPSLNSQSPQKSIDRHKHLLTGPPNISGRDPPKEVSAVLTVVQQRTEVFP